MIALTTMKGASHTDFLQIWHLQLIYWKMQFWCCFRVGHLHTFFKPNHGDFE